MSTFLYPAVYYGLPVDCYYFQPRPHYSFPVHLISFYTIAIMRKQIAGEAINTKRDLILARRMQRPLFFLFISVFFFAHIYGHWNRLQETANLVAYDSCDSLVKQCVCLSGF